MSRGSVNTHTHTHTHTLTSDEFPVCVLASRELGFLQSPPKGSRLGSLQQAAGSPLRPGPLQMPEQHAASPVVLQLACSPSLLGAQHLPSTQFPEQQSDGEPHVAAKGFRPEGQQAPLTQLPTQHCEVLVHVAFRAAHGRPVVCWLGVDQDEDRCKTSSPATTLITST